MKKGELKRSSILKAAEMLFFERGYDRTSVQDILDALSLSKGGFYHHFPSKKEAVLEEVSSTAFLRGSTASAWICSQTGRARSTG